MDSQQPAGPWNERLRRLLAPLSGRPYDPDTLRSVPSWGLSFLLHALLLLVLAQGLRITIANLGKMGAVTFWSNPSFWIRYLLLFDSVVANTVTYN
jgi:hypothetical protein